jgi:hypothetical protein
MRKLFTLLSFVVLSSTSFALIEINYTVNSPGNCFPKVASISVSTNSPDVDMYSISINGGPMQFRNIANPYAFMASSPNFSFEIEAYAFGAPVATLYDSHTLSGSTYSLSASGSMPYSTGVGVPFPIQLNTNDANISSIQWNFGNGQMQNGGSSVNPTYNTAGFYLVTCTIESADCGTVVRQLELYVSAIQTVIPSNICVGQSFTLTFSDMHPSTEAVFYVWNGGSVSSTSNQVNLTFWEQGPAFITVYCYNDFGSLVDLMTFELEVSGEYYKITPYWSFIKLGETIEFTLQTESGNPLDAYGLSWSVGGTTPTVTALIDNAGYQTISVSYVNACTQDVETAQANFYAVDGQVTVDTEACAPSSFTVTYTGDVIAGIIGMTLVEEDQFFNGVSTFDFNFTQAGFYNVKVFFGTGDGAEDLTYQIYIPGPTVNTVSITTCGSYQFGPDLLTESGSYTHIFQTPAGCDSTVNLSLTIVPNVVASISYNAGVLSASGGSSYQWFNCTTGAFIPGATGATYTPQEVGLYGVVAYLGDCSDSTEVCFQVTYVGLDDIVAQNIEIYPNPAQVQVSIAHAAGATCMIYDTRGQLVYNQQINDEFSNVDLNQFEAGVYIVNFIHSNGKFDQKRLVVIK